MEATLLNKMQINDSYVDQPSDFSSDQEGEVEAKSKLGRVIYRQRHRT